MRYVIEAGTDAASLLLFDPGALPADFERQFQSDTVDVLGRLSNEGKACWVATDGDGLHLVHAFVDEHVPKELWGFAVAPEVIEEFLVPTGQLFVTGSEYAFREDDSFLRRHPQMGGFVSIRPGTYRLTVFRTRYPEQLVEDLFRAQAGPQEYWLWRSTKALIPLAVAAWICLVVIFFTTVRVPFPRFLSALLGLILALPFLVHRLETYRAARRRFESLEREHPALVAHLEFRLPVVREGAKSM
jgi:hypothetical protein